MRSRLAASLLALLFWTGTFSGCRESAPPAPEPAAPPAPPAADATPASHPDCFGDAGATQGLVFRSGDTLDGLLRQAAVSGEGRAALAAAIGRVHDLGAFRVGRPLHILHDCEGELLGLDYPLDFARDLCAWRVDEGFRAEIIHAGLDWRLRALTATLMPSFYESLAAQGQSGDLATRVADLFAGEVDFFLDLRPGDRMEILVETAERGDRPEPRSRVLAASMVLDGIPRAAYLFPDPDGRRRYYHADGSSLERQFLRAPLNFSSISSGFSHRRLHPILGVHRPHYGVDYTAPMGTPVLATADGTVIRRQRSESAGRSISLRHPGGIETTYMHFSRFARGTSEGARVSKGQEIGYVGNSGLSTGSHLDYRVKVAGNYVDPRRFRSNPSMPLAADRRELFGEAVAHYDSLWVFCLAVRASRSERDRASASETASE